MRVMLVDDDQSRLTMLHRALSDDGHEVVARLAADADLLDAVKRHAPEIVLIDVDAPTRDTLESLSQVTRDVPRPVVMFAAHSDADTTRRALRAGVSAYVVDGLVPSRLRSVIEVAIARFHEHRALVEELHDAKSRLADRRDIDRAKGLLMSRRGIGEDAAYEQLRKLAMDRNIRIGEAARVLIAAAELI